MSLSEIKRQLHFAIDESRNEDFLQDLLSLFESPSNRNDFARLKQWDASKERDKAKLRNPKPAGTGRGSKISLKDRYYFEDRAF